MAIALIDGLSARAPSGYHVLGGHLRELARRTAGRHRFVLLHDLTQDALGKDLPENISAIRLGIDLTSPLRRAVWQKTQLSKEVRRAGADLIFTPAGSLPPVRLPVPQVCFAQNPWCLTEAVPKKGLDRIRAAVQRRAYRAATAEADLMIYNSNHLRQLYRDAGAPAATRELILYQAVDESARKAAAASGVPRRDDLILSVSVMARWKNAETLIRAGTALRNRGRRFEIRFVGPWSHPDYRAEIEAEIAASGLQDYIRIVGRVSRDELYRHYAEATVFCLMSRCESFGIPAVEAQTFGVPVIGSTACAMPEIGGAGGRFCDPDDVTAVADHLDRLLTDRNHHAELSAAARENAERFRWERVTPPLEAMFDLC
ncbi:glycosyltransferase [Alienimonas chondri]|uniref:D-inositol-3-phosphate glycosyltransferase n=1 Tax=Alienimonas chondri TaxID=2681879 RepID=A0ABX1VF21_9PLAN|nr:glycosyltransferase [Alienimonas chondri]NNJ26388.1 D-inositol-3-phosphate glycosyltransferase [Alienimonas chondri]